MKYMIALLLAASPVLASAAPNNDKAAVQAAIAQYYNRPLAAHNCQLTEPPKDSETASDNIMYCMKPVADHSVTRNGKATRYVLYTGFAYDMKYKLKQGAHASSGLAELFVLEKTDGKWTIKQHGKDEIGAWGTCRRIRLGSLSRWVSKTGATLSNQAIRGKAKRQLEETFCLPIIATVSVAASL